MKKLITLTALALTMCFFSTKTFAQRDAGGSSDGTSNPPPAAQTFTVPVGSSIVLNFTQPASNNIPTLTSISYNGNVIAVNGNLSNISCLNFYQFFQVLFACANHYHTPGCHQSPCRNPRCH